MNIAFVFPIPRLEVAPDDPVVALAVAVLDEEVLLSAREILQLALDDRGATDVDPPISTIKQAMQIT